MENHGNPCYCLWLHKSWLYPLSVLRDAHVGSLEGDRLDVADSAPRAPACAREGKRCRAASPANRMKHYFAKLAFAKSDEGRSWPIHDWYPILALEEQMLVWLLWPSTPQAFSTRSV